MRYSNLESVLLVVLFGVGFQNLSQCSEKSDLENARALVQLAIDAENDRNADKGSRLRNEAIIIFSEIAQTNKELGDKFRQKLNEAVRNIRNWKRDKANNESEIAPKNLIEALKKAVASYIPRDKMYILLNIEAIEVYRDNDPKMKIRAKELANYCGSQANSEDILQLNAACKWYWLVKGRLHSKFLDEAKATESWRNVLEGNEHLSFKERKAIEVMKESIYHDLVKMKMRLGSQDPSKFSEIVDILQAAQGEPNIETFFGKPEGKDLLIDYAIALVQQPNAGAKEYRQAIEILKKMIECKNQSLSSRARKEILIITEKINDASVSGDPKVEP